MSIQELMLAVFVALLTTITVTTSAFASHGSDYASCKNDGLYDGENSPFSQELYKMCGDTYYHFFIEGCMSVEGNTEEECEQATDAGE
jgi:hypothetical protein